MATGSLETQYTPEDLLLMPDGHRYDLIDGQLKERHMGAEASSIAMAIYLLIGPHIRSRGLGRPFNSECGYQIFGAAGNNVRFPDGSFIARGKLPDDRAPRGHVRIAPDWVLEVVSPNDLAEELEQKIEEYLQVGVRLIWVVFPVTRRIMVYRRGGQVSRLTPADQLSGEDVIPDFVCRVEEVFAGI